VSLPLVTDAKPIRFLFLPPEHDPDSYIREHGKEAFEQLVRAAPTLSEFLIAELRAEHDLNTPEGRAGFLSASKAYLEKLTAPVLRMQILREFATLGRVSVEEVQGLVQTQRGPAAPTGPTYRQAAPARAAAPIASSQERNLLRCVLARPGLAAELDDELLDPEQPETGALRAIAELGLEDGASGAVLVERFQGTEYEQIVFQTQASDLVQDFAVDAAGEEFRQIQLALRIKHMHKAIETLNRDAAVNPALRPELQRRLQELNQLKSQRT
jgi:DNA primase